MWKKTTVTKFETLLEEYQDEAVLAINRSMEKGLVTLIYYSNIKGDFEDKEWQNANFLLKLTGSTCFRWTKNKVSKKKGKKS